MIRLIGQPRAATSAMAANTQPPGPAYVVQVPYKRSHCVALLDAGRDLALKEIDLELRDQPRRHRTASGLIGHASVELTYAILRAGIEAHPAERR